MTARSAAEACVRLIAGHRAASLLLLALAMVLAWTSYGRAVGWDLDAAPVDNGIEIWFLEDDPALVAYREFQRTFGNDEAVLIALRDEALWTSAGLTRLGRLSEALGRVPRVRGVTSLSTVLHAGSDAEGALVVDRMFRAPVLTADDAAAVRAKVDADPLYRRELLSPDGLTTLVSVQLEGFEDVDRERGPILAALRRTVDEVLAREGAPDLPRAWGGVGVIHEALNTIVMRDSGVLFGASGAVIVLCLAVALRRASAVVMAVLTVYTATTLLVGLYLGLGYRLNMVTMVLPTLVMVIGLTDSIYFITSWYQERDELLAQGLTRREAVVRCVGFCFLPGLFNSVTAAVGFLAFASARMEVIRVMGVFAGVGILLAFVTSVVVCTIGLDVLDPHPRARAGAGAGAGPGPADRALGWISSFVARRRRAVLVAGGLLAIVALGGILRLQVDTYTIRYFHEDHPVRQDDAWIEAHYGPYLPLETVVVAGDPHGVGDPAVLRGMQDLQARVEADPEGRVRSAVSLVGVVSRLNEVLDGEHRLPDSVEAVEQELLLWDPDRPDDPLRLVDGAHRQARITFRTKNASARAGGALIDDVEAQAKASLPPGATLVPAGYVPLYVLMIDYLVEGQVWSLGTTFLVIVVVIGGMFRSLRYALLALPANVIPVAGTLGFMGYAGIDLDASTVLIASISLGIAVDDTIHFLFKFRALAEESGDDARAVDETLRTTGVAIAATSLVLALGFAVICLAEVKSVALFGLLTAVTMVSALIGELFVTPAVILTFARGAKSYASDGSSQA